MAGKIHNRSHIHFTSTKKRGLSRWISVIDGCNKGLATWSWVCPPEIDKDVRADEGAREVAADPDLDNGVLTSPERQHRP